VTGTAPNIALAQAPSTVGDVVGRTVRAIRVNYKWLFRFLIVPSVLNALSWLIASWVTSQSASDRLSLVNTVYIGISVIGMILSGWELNIRGFALLILATAPKIDLKTALSKARTRAWTIFALFVPVLLANFVFIGMTWFIGLIGTTDATSEDDAVTILLILAVAILSIFPYGVVITLSSFLAAIISKDGTPLWSSFVRACYLASKAPLLLISSLFVFGFVYSVLQIPLLFIESLHNGFESLPGQTSAVVSTIAKVIEWVAFSLSIAYFCAYSFIGGLFVYHEFCMRLEGEDIAQRLQAMEHIENKTPS
jgi:hypothetical protein